MPFKRLIRRSVRPRRFTKKVKKVGFKNHSFRKRSNVQTAVRGVAGTVYNSYTKPRTTRGKVKRIVSSKIRAIKALGNPNYTPINYGNQCVTTAQGVCLLQVIAQAFDQADLSTLLVNFQTAQNVISGSNVQPPSKFVTDGFRGQYTLKNNTNVDLEMDLYWCLSRRDVDSNQVASSTFGNGVHYADIRTPLITGYKEQTDATVTTTTWPLGVTPFQITRFCEMFKILRTKRVLLGGGRNTIVKMVLPKSIMWNTELINNINDASTYLAFANKTLTILAIVRGEVINDTTTKSLVSTSNVQFNLLGEESYTMYPAGTVGTTLVPPTALSTISTNTVITQETELVVAQATT